MGIARLGLCAALIAAICAAASAQAEEIQGEGAAVLRLRVPFGPGAKVRTRTLSLGYAPIARPEIEAPRPAPRNLPPVVEVGLAFNGDAFLNFAQSQVMRVVRVSLHSSPDNGRGGRFPTPLAAPAQNPTAWDGREGD